MEEGSLLEIGFEKYPRPVDPVELHETLSRGNINKTGLRIVVD